MSDRQMGRARGRQNRDRKGDSRDAARRDLRIDAIASRDRRERGQAAAKALGIAKAYGSYEELLADPEIEAIYNPLPNELHVPWTEHALAAGKHVLCEKPIALDADEAARLIAARDRSGKLVAEAFMVRYHPQWRRAREIVRSGGDRRGRRDPDAVHLPPARPRRISATSRRAAAGSTTSAATRS